MSRKEIIFLLAVLFVGAALFIGTGIYKRKHQRSESIVIVTSDGNECLHGLLQNYGSYTFYYEGGYNTIVIDADGVTVTEADCPGQDCVKKGHIQYSGETIVCLPHKLVITIQ